MASYADLLAPDNFNWADEAEEMETDISLKSDITSSYPCLFEEPQLEPTTTIIVAEDTTLGNDLVSEDESVTESWIFNSDDTTATSITDSNADNNDEKGDSDPQSSTGITSMTGMMHNINHTFGWRHYSAYYESGIHHFNWFGQPVYQRSLTAPADSLAIILVDPKVPEVKEDLRVQTLLRCAFTFLDPVVVSLEHAPPHLLLRRGSQLQHAATGLTSRYYTPHGQWMVDMGPDRSKVVVDDGNVHTYIKPELAVGNGFVQSNQIPSSAEWMRAHANKIASLSQWKPPRKHGWKPAPSPLCEMMSLSDAKPRLRRKPGREQLRVCKDAPSPLSSSVLSAVSTPCPSPLSSTSPSTLSTSSSTPPTTLSSPYRSARCPGSSTRSAPSSLPSSHRWTTDPSRDPETYWSFPLPKIVGPKPKRSFRRALKKTAKSLWSVLKAYKTPSVTY